MVGRSERSKRETQQTLPSGPHFTFEMWRIRVLLWALIIANIAGFIGLGVLEYGI